MDYQSFLANSESLDVIALIAFLREELPFCWIEDYKQATPRETSILRVELGSFVYDYDFVTELVKKGVLGSEVVREDRLVAGYGVSNTNVDRRDLSRMRGWVGPTEQYLGTDRDKGHVFGRALGGGLEINLFSQKRSLNRYRSAEGRIFRSMEKHCAAHPGTFCFFRPFYQDQTSRPVSFEFGILLPDKKLWVEEFEN
jgi:hypothetical protein